MLVCSVSQRPSRRAIAAELLEAAAAADGLNTGNVVFATIVDDPASVAEFVDAFLGEIMLEAASAADAYEVVNIYEAAIAEAAAADDVSDANVPLILATLDGTPDNVTVTNAGLTATHINTSNFSGVPSTASKSAGKYYFEATLGATHSTNADSIGILKSTGSVAGMGSGTDAVVTVSGTGLAGRILTNGTNSTKTLGSDWVAGDIICFAIDLDNRKAWLRKSTGDWNNEALGISNPATNTGGVTIATGNFRPAVGFSSSATTGDSVTMNFGNTSFAAAAPIGFGYWTA